MSTGPVGRCLLSSNLNKLSVNTKFAAVSSIGTGEMAWFVFLLFLIVVSAYFAAAETAYSSVNRIKIKSLADNGDKRAGRVLLILENMDKTLTTLLVGTNVCHIAAATISTMLATRIWGLSAVTATTIVVTLIIFMFSETLPKIYATYHAESFSLSWSSFTKALITVLAPVTWIFSGINSLVNKVFHAEETPTVKEEELYDIIENIQDEGGMDDSKSDLIYSALEFDDISVSDILTPRIDVVSVDIEDPIDEIINVIKDEKFSRVPVTDGTMDNVIGILNSRKLIKSYIANKNGINIHDFLDKPIYAHKSMPVDVLLKKMNTQKHHLAIIKDEYGGTLGIVTSEDILEELVGEIWDEDEVVTEDFKKLDDGTFEVTGDLAVEDAFDLVGIEDFDREEIGSKNISAWALEFFDSEIPAVGSCFVYDGWRFEVYEMDHFRITGMLVKKNGDDPVGGEVM